MRRIPLPTAAIFAGVMNPAFTVKGERIGLGPNWLLIEKTKNLKQRRIPLSKAARNTADHLPGYDFRTDTYWANPATGSQVKDIKHAFRGCLRRGRH